jgi:hypothetical protein
MTNTWPFSDPKNLEVLTTVWVLRGRSIVYVTHDRDDGSWQFLDGGPTNLQYARIVSLDSITRLDPSILELGDLPLGWKAWRSAKNTPWRRAPQ